MPKQEGNGNKDLQSLHTQTGQRKEVEAGTINYYTGIDWAAIAMRLLESIHWIMLSGAVCAVAVAIYVVFFVTPIYQATSKIYMVGTETTISISDLQLGSSLAQDYQEVFKNREIHELVKNRMQLPYSEPQLQNMLSVSNPSGTHVLYINVNSSNPQEAKEMADVYSEVVREFIAKTMDIREPSMFEGAKVPTRPISPNKRKMILTGFGFGIFASICLIVFLYLLDDRIRTTDDIKRVNGLNTLGVIPLQADETERRNELFHLPLGRKKE